MKVTMLNRFGRYVIAEVQTTRPIEEGKAPQIVTGIGISRKSDEDSFKQDVADRIAIGRAKKAALLKLEGKRTIPPFMG